MLNIFLNAIAFLTIATVPLFSGQVEIDPPGVVAIALSFASTPEEKAWGLMGRSSLEENEGLLFPYTPPRIASIWMFNVYFDLSLAFVDANGFIQELHHAKAYPEMLKPEHKISNVYELHKFTLDDPVIKFFAERSIRSREAVHYALEMKAGWFSRHQIQVGDKLVFPTAKSNAYILQRSINLSDLGAFRTDASNPTKLILKDPGAIAVWLPEKQPDILVKFYDQNDHEIENATLKAASGYYVSEPVKYFVFDKLNGSIPN